MKYPYPFTLLLLALGLTALRAEETKITVPGLSGGAANAAPAEPSAPAEPAKPEFTDEQLLEELGWFLGTRVGMAEMELSKADIDAVVKGVAAAASGKPSPQDLDQVGPAMSEFMQKKRNAVLDRLKNKNVQANQEFFAKLKEDKNVTELPSGLRYEITKQGEGPTPKPSDTVKVHYKGTLIDGTIFDSSIGRNKPAEFSLNSVIPGWTEGIQKINTGGKIKLYVPPHLGYGDAGNQGIPPAATLIFEVELLEIEKPAEAEKKG